MQVLLLRGSILSLIAAIALLAPCPANSQAVHSQINPDDTYVTFDATTVRQSNFTSPASELDSSATTNPKMRSGTPREQKFHLEEGYDAEGKRVLDITVLSASSASNPVLEARFSGGTLALFGANGAPIHSKSIESHLASAIAGISGASLIKGPVAQDILAYARATSATIVGDMPAAEGPASVTLRIPTRGPSGEFTKTFTRTNQGWELSQIAFSRQLANGNTSSVTSFSNVHWHQNPANDSARIAAKASRSPLIQPPSSAPTPRVDSLPAKPSILNQDSISGQDSNAIVAATQEQALTQAPAAAPVQAASSCPTTVTNLGGAQNVVFQHGLEGSGCSWTDSSFSMTAALNGALSFATEIVPSLPSTEALATQTSALVSQLQTTGGSHYVLIGHSQGGLISRSAAQFFQNNSPTTVTGVITVDTPNMGAPIIKNGIGAASQVGNYLSFIVDDINGVFDCYDEFGDYGPFCAVGCDDPNGGELLCALLLGGTGDGNIINDAIAALGIYVLNQSIPATIDLEPGSAFLNTLNSFPENFVRVGIVSDSTDIYGPFLPEQLGGDLVSASFGEDTVLTLQIADAALNGIIGSLIGDEISIDCTDFPDQEECVNDDAYIFAFATIDNDLFVPDAYFDPLPLPNECCDFSDGIVNGQSQFYPPQSSVVQYVIEGADTHLASTKSPIVASALLTALERNFFVPAKGCTYTLSPTSVTEPVGGGKGTFTITTGSTCGWTVQSNASWLTFTPANGTGSATISYTVAANPGSSRNGDLVVAGGLAMFAVAQNGTPMETLTVTVSGSGGTVTSSPAGIACPGTCSAVFALGTKVTLSASAALGFKFMGWSGACSGTGSCVVTMSSAQSVTATFIAEPAQTLTLTTSGSGSVTSMPAGISCPGTCSASFAYGTTVTLTASPAGGYTFAGWGGACSGTGACAVTMISAAGVSAGFEQPAPGIINTTAGNGTAGFSGDGGAAISAELHGDNAVAVDGAGNMYIADYYNNRIRKVTASTGVISTVAGNGTAGFSGDGGAATSAEINGPGDIAVDSAGNIYISDLNNNRVRKVTASTGVISTVAGNGTKGFTGDGGAATSAEIGPNGVGVDTAGNLYMADEFSNRVRKVTASTGIISTVAGNGTAGFTGDGGAATSAELNVPDAVLVDGAGNIYISDHNNERIRKVTASTGKISTIAGNGTAGYSGDGGAATSAELNGPGGLALDGAGNLYIGDFGNNRVRKVTVSTGVISTAAGNGVAGYSGDGGSPASAEMNGPSGIAMDKTGNLYIADFGNERIRTITASISTVAGNGTAGFSGDGGAAISAELHGDNAVAVDGAGNMYIADYYNNRIRKVTASTGVISTVAGNGTAGFSGDGGAATSAEINGPGDVAVDSAGNIYISDLNNNRVRKVTASTGVISTVAGNGTKGFTGDGGAATSAEIGPNGVGVDTAGNLYMADEFSNRIRKVTASTGIISTVAGNGTAGFTGDGGAATSAELNVPDGVLVDSAGNIYISDHNNERIRKVTASTGKISTIAGNGTAGYSGDGGAATSAELNGPGGLALDGAGNLYIGDFGNNRVRKVTVSTGVISTAAGNGVAGYSGDGGPPASAEMNGPSGIALDKTGNLYIADFGNERIRLIGR
jgi:sugar lactone lactonase YvrE